MLSYSELNKGKIIIINNQPYEIVEAFNTFKGRGHSYLQMKLKNLVNGSIISRSSQPRDSFEEAAIEKKDAKFVYQNKGKYVFSETENASKRFELTEKQIGEKDNIPQARTKKYQTIIFEDKIINVSMPIKVKLKVTEVTPRSQRRQGPGRNQISDHRNRRENKCASFRGRGRHY